VIMTNNKLYNYPYMATVPAAVSLTRDTAFTWTANAITNEQLDVATPYVANTHIDVADMAQCRYENQMEYADLFGKELNEQVEYAVLGNYANCTDFDKDLMDTGTAGTTNITVTTENIDNICGALIREIREANGGDLLNRNGAFIIWAAADYELLESWARVNGYNTADDIIVNGIKVGTKYLGVEHYYSNKHTSRHLLGGVKKLFHVGILNATYGKVDIVPFPASTSNLYSIGIASRIDYGIKVFANYKPLLFDIQCA